MTIKFYGDCPGMRTKTQTTKKKEQRESIASVGHLYASRSTLCHIQGDYGIAKSKRTVYCWYGDTVEETIKYNHYVGALEVRQCFNVLADD